MSRIAAFLVTVLGSLVVPAGLQAAIVHMAFSGHVFSDPRNLYLPPQLAGSIAPGDPVSGEFLYDPGPPSSATGPGEGDYGFPGPPFFLDLTIAGVPFSDPTAGYGLQVLNDVVIGSEPAGVDRLLFQRFFNGPWDVPGSIGPSYIQLIFRDPTLQALSSPALPSVLPPLTAFDFPLGEVSTVEDTSLPPTLFIAFRIEEWHVVPETPVMLLSWGSLVAVAALRRALRV